MKTKVEIETNIKLNNMKVMAKAPKKKPIKEYMGEFIESHPEFEDYHKGFEAYEAAGLPKAGKGLFAFVWNKVKGSTRAKKVSPLEKTEAYFDVVRALHLEQEKHQNEMSKYHMAGLLTENADEKVALKAKEEIAKDAMFAINRKIRNYLEAYATGHKVVAIETQTEN